MKMFEMKTWSKGLAMAEAQAASEDWCHERIQFTIDPIQNNFKRWHLAGKYPWNIMSLERQLNSGVHSSCVIG